MRLLVNVEGQTEENFVNLVLAPHLQGFGYDNVSARILGNPRNTARGGICGWPQARRDLERRTKQDRELLQTTFVDFYAMPASGPRAWPGRAEAAGETGAAARSEVVPTSTLHRSKRPLYLVTAHSETRNIRPICQKTEKASARARCQLPFIAPSRIRGWLLFAKTCLPQLCPHSLTPASAWDAIHPYPLVLLRLRGCSCLVLLHRPPTDRRP